MFLRDGFFIIALWFGFPTPTHAEVTSLNCTGQTVQGGLLLCEAPANSTLIISGPKGEAERKVPVNGDGVATVGILRTETLELSIASQEYDFSPQIFQLTKRNDPFRTIEGLDCDKVDARTPEQKAHAGRSWQKKQTAFSTFSAGDGARKGFMLPAEGPKSSPFGPARKYIGIGKDGEPCEKTSVHYGYDIAIPVGTPIVAPAAGTVTLADEDLYYEGGTVFLDHGDGLVSVFMHMSAINVEPGHIVEVGELLGLSGNTGRTTGPHLHWAIKWRNPSSDDRRRDFYIDPELLLNLEPMP